MNTTSVAVPYSLKRLGTVMAPRPGDPLETEGVLNPAALVGEDGELYLYPRMVAAGNVSRVGRCRVTIDEDGAAHVERLGVVMEPREGWERGKNNAGVEDPRITRLEEAGLWVMTYIAFGPLGPRPALAISYDGESWDRLGPLQFQYQPELSLDPNLFANKDIVFFLETVIAPDGRRAYPVLHRPMWDLDWLREGEGQHLPANVDDPRPSIWIGFVDAEAAKNDVAALTRIYDSRVLAFPEMPYEANKIGAGPAPIRVPEGWLLIHHGVTGVEAKGFELAHGACYAAGAMLLDDEEPWKVIGRTSEPILVPETEEELSGTLGNVVFPTAITNIDGRNYVFYGMADSKIGMALLERDNIE
ncbi:glycoside hydrolase family 130 protein [Scrofimicrobium canadense]|nr:hypothetical protein [Scrofimicrobium canadense]